MVPPTGFEPVSSDLKDRRPGPVGRRRPRIASARAVRYRTMRGPSSPEMPRGLRTPTASATPVKSSAERIASSAPPAPGFLWGEGAAGRMIEIHVAIEQMSGSPERANRQAVGHLDLGRRCLDDVLPQLHAVAIVLVPAQSAGDLGKRPERSAQRLDVVDEITQRAGSLAQIAERLPGELIVRRQRDAEQLAQAGDLLLRARRTESRPLQPGSPVQKHVRSNIFPVGTGLDLYFPRPVPGGDTVCAVPSSRTTRVRLRIMNRTDGLSVMASLTTAQARASNRQYASFT